MTDSTTPKRRGRPPGSTLTAIIPAQRVTPAQRAMWDALGRESGQWLRDALDREIARRSRAMARAATDVAAAGRSRAAGDPGESAEP